MLNDLSVKRSNFEQAFNELVTTIKNYQKELTTNFQIKHLHSLKQQLRIDFFNNVLTQYYEAHTLKETMKKFQSLRNNFQCSAIPITTYLSKEAYNDFILFVHMLKPEKLNTILHQYKNIFQIKLQQTQKQAQLLKRRFDKSFFEAVRVQRIISIYKLWGRYLESNSQSNDLTQMLQLYRLLTYDKKGVFRQGFTNQVLYTELQALDNFIQIHRNKSAQDLLADLIIEKNNLCTQIRSQEEQLQADYNGMQKMLGTVFSTVVLGILQHPEYQLGRFTTEFIDHTFTRCSWLPIMKETLPPGLKNKAGHASGFCVLLMSLIFSTRLGYSYQLIATLSRIPLSHIDTLFKIGSWLDSIGVCIDHSVLIPLENMSPEQISNIFEQYRNLIRWDELGVIEKDALLQWTTGLCIQIMLALLSGGQSIIPAVAGYMVATGCREGAGRLTQKITQKYGLSREASTFARIIANITTYTCTYPYGFKLGVWYQQRRSAEISYTEALKTLGLHSKVTEEEVQKKYHKLALQLHPDKCKTEDCAKQMVELNNAYEILTKKMQ